jgi:hypothetical protein
MMIRSVPSTEISPKSLRASDYVVNSGRIAKELVDAWVKENVLLKRDSPPMRSLQARIALAIHKTGSFVR